ncbi:hypothetical protein [Chitinophaga cymbidii]|uniref:Uncharacterized protein n=1 Tax=Chitinophaga cymbidii TaxID=1096750 RepID=A0A512RQW0_9BACT|nr:hypothetical protein [Chitinophaga cymbidii]GEP98103.1 hypothetical protein CCY01nite_43630 [Chitinophaga cymbidii]
MKKVILSLFVLSVIVTSLHCKKERGSKPPAGDQLPPITQEGKHTIGFKIGDEVIIPKGFTGVSNPTVIYDPTLEGGSLSISMYHINKKDSIEQFLIIGAKNLYKTGTYRIASPMEDVGIKFSKIFVNTNTGCDYNFRDDDVKQTGSLKITRLDLSAQIISGTFSVVMIKSGCDTISIKDGRFDLRL